MIQFESMLQIKDVFLTPIYLILFYILAMYMRPALTTPLTIKYYMPALYLKFGGAIALGLLYTFYYGAGDTTSYFYHIRLLDDALWEAPAVWLQLILAHGQEISGALPYYGRMFWYGTGSEYMVIRIGGVLTMFCFGTYMVIALCFAFISFTGLWAMFRTFNKLYPHLHRQFAIALFFMPSVFFWGSGLMKDSLCLGGLGWIFFCFHRAVVERKKIIQSLLIVLLVSYPVLAMKSYILIAFIPPALFWIINEAGSRIKSRFLRRLMAPVLFVGGLAVAVVGLNKMSADDDRFNLDKVAERAKITSDYIYRVSVEQGGAGYQLGAMDGTMAGMLALAPAAINVTLFRPYLWEVRNPIMLLSALEALLFLYLTLTLVWRTGLIKTVRLIFSVPILQLCFTFALLFSMSVGLSTNNFGTLARYKVQMMPFYLSGLYIANHLSALERKRRAVAFARA